MTGTPGPSRRARAVIRSVNPLGLSVIVLVVLLWQGATSIGPLAARGSFPAPSEVWHGLTDLAADGGLWSSILHTLQVVAVSSAIAIVVGGAIGLTLGLSGTAQLFFGSTIDVLRTIPMIALMPVALLIWGPEARTEIIVSSVAAAWPMVVNARGGVLAIHPRLHDVGATFQFSRGRTIRHLIIPAAVPQLLVGARLAIVTALVAAIIAEMVITPAGLGWDLVHAQLGLQTGRMWAAAAVCAVLGVALNRVLIFAVTRVYGTHGTGA